MVLGNELLKAGVDECQPLGHRLARRKFDRAAIDVQQAIVGEQLDYAVAGIFGAAVDAEDAHGESLAFSPWHLAFSTWLPHLRHERWNGPRAACLVLAPRALF